MSATDPAAGQSFRDRMHELLRKSILDAAWDAASKTDWSNVRIVDIAETVGVSRQTIYNEFGTKEDLAQALFTREVELFQIGLAEAIDGSESLGDAARNALRWLFDEVRGHAMMQWMLRDARENNTEGSLLPLLTVRASAFALPIRGMLMQEFSRRWPGTDEVRGEMAIDLVMRWAISHIIVPTDFDEAEVIERIVEMTEFALRPAHATSVPQVAGA